MTPHPLLAARGPAGPALADPGLAGLDSPAGRYQRMALIRGFEELALRLVESGDVAGGIHPYIGEEAVAVGVCAGLRASDLITSTHRGHGHVLAKGSDPRRMLAELCGKASGLNGGRGGSMHAADVSVGILGANAIVGAAAPIAAGAAFAARRSGADTIVATFLGDGALNQGVLLEALNLAALWHLPVLFACENNGYATTMPVATAVAGTAAGRAAAFGIPAVTVDGMDVEAVHEATRDAAAAMRPVPAPDGGLAGGGPALIECLTYRFGPHHTIEKRVRLSYRTAQEIAAWRQRDPLAVAGARLDGAERARLEERVAAVLAEAERFALDSPPPDPGGALDHLYASAPFGRGMSGRAL
ncbi:MAG TPA: thiamine pyrophosphate-dependent dehydrogenase E1 component subunit alpha [Streptosporangiaceae bacterium]|jgi:pyruvate dehydrogenase E1 component alpha subunit